MKFGQLHIVLTSICVASLCLLLLFKGPSHLARLQKQRLSCYHPEPARGCPDGRPFPHGAATLSSKSQKYISDIFHNKSDAGGRGRTKCTLIMQTYRRVANLPRLLTHYCKLNFVDKLLVIYFDVDTPLPDHVLELKDKCATELIFIHEEEDLLCNRFKPRPEIIDTKCILTVDDDRYVEHRDLEMAFQVWKEFPHRIVGFQYRSHVKLNDLYLYQRFFMTKASMILPTTSVFHRAYLSMFYDPNFMPREMVDFINKAVNCEDIALNFMVCQFLADVNKTQPCIVPVYPKGKLKNLDGAKVYKGLSYKSDHTAVRNECLNKFVYEFYDGIMPLTYTSL